MIELTKEVRPLILATQGRFKDVSTIGYGAMRYIRRIDECTVYSGSDCQPEQEAS